MKKFRLIMLVLITTCGIAQGAIINVPGSQPTIQAGINAAFPGDTVMVASGTYTGPGNYDIDTMGKAITITSQNGATQCVIDVYWSGRGFYLHSGEGTGTVINGFTIRNGWVLDQGGGIGCFNASPTITNCVISDCTARNNGGGALYFSGSTNAIVAFTTIANNTSENRGGGAYAMNSTCTFNFCTFTGNTATNFEAKGGAISCQPYCTLLVMNSTFDNNSADYGGAVHCKEWCDPAFYNCLFFDNQAPNKRGGAIMCDQRTPSDILNCTFEGNSTGQYGGGIHLNDYSPATIKNCIFWNNSPDQIHAFLQSSPTVTYCDVQGGYTGNHNLNSNPLFTSGLDGAYYLSQIPSGQPSNSPCFNAGENLANLTCFPPSLNTYCMGSFTTAINQAVDIAVADMGAHYVPTTYVTPTPTPWQPPVPAASPGGCIILAGLFSVLLMLRRLV
ncbi:right-handed parallel beta-helix repeat-containing protein [bacterium]|nr:right-handed parallel beta-helix repeat-containing protein [candidate division CSSED10-310 bacterium]